MSTAKLSIAEVRRVIADQYHLFPPATIAAICGRSVGYVRCLASAMGFRSVGRGKNHDPYFSASDIKTLRREFGVVPLVELARRLNRTPAALAAKCSRLGLGRRRSAEWTSADDAFVRQEYPTRGSAIAGDLGRSANAVKHRARKLGVLFETANHPWRKEIASEWQLKRERKQSPA